MYELTPRFDSHQSFYHKAMVSETATGYRALFSYGSVVASVIPAGTEHPATVSLFDLWDSSATTLRHVKEFLRQNGFKADTKEQMRADYC